MKQGQVKCIEQLRSLLKLQLLMEKSYL